MLGRQPLLRRGHGIDSSGWVSSDACSDRRRRHPRPASRATATCRHSGLVLSDLSGELFDCKRDGPGHRHLFKPGERGGPAPRGTTRRRPVGRHADRSARQRHPSARRCRPWTEFWTIDRCGDAISFYISFEPTPTEGTKITTRDASGKPASSS